MGYFTWYSMQYGDLYAFYQFWGRAFFQTGWLSYVRSTGSAIGMFIMMKLLQPHGLTPYF